MLLRVFRIPSAPIYVIPQPSVVWVPELGKNYKAQSGFSRRRLLRWHFATGYLLGSSTRGKKRKQDWVEGEVKLTQAPLNLNHPYRELWILYIPSGWTECPGLMYFNSSCHGIWATLGRVPLVKKALWNLEVEAMTAWAITSSLKEDLGDHLDVHQFALCVTWTHFFITSYGDAPLRFWWIFFLRENSGVSGTNYSPQLCS